MEATMQNTRIVIVPVIIVLALYSWHNAMAQDDGGIAPLFKFLVSSGQKESTRKSEQAEPGRNDVLRDINSCRKEIARLRAAGKTDREISGSLRSRQAVTGTGSITGTVYASDGVTPISSYASVWAYNEFGRYSGYGSANSFSNGVYEIQNLSTGDYYLQLSPSSPFAEEYYNGVIDWGNATLVHVADGQQTTGINFVLHQYLGAITGVVSAVDSTPLAQCIVHAYDLSSNPVAADMSDSTGTYTIIGLPSGDYKLEATGLDSTNVVAQWYDGAESYDKAMIVHVTEPETTKAKDFFLMPSGGISGTVVTEGGDSVPSGACEIVVRDLGGSWRANTMTTSGGAFYVPNLATGRYLVSYSYHGGLNYVDGWYDGSGDALHATPIGVVAPETTNVTILLRRGGSIAGKVLYPVVPHGVAVIAYDEEQDQSWGVTSGTNGEFLISRLPAGRYKVLASSLKSYSFSGPHAIDKWYNGAADFAHATFVNVHPPDTTGGIEIILERGGSISGTVASPTSLPLTSGASVYVCDVRGKQIVARQVSGFTYSVSGLPTGQYKVFCSYTGTDNFASEWYNGKTSFQNAAVINVIAPASVVNVNFSLEYRATVGGFVTDKGGTRLTDSDHLIQVLFYTESGEYVGYRATSFVGGFQTTVLPGRYKLAAVSSQSNAAPLQDSLGVFYYDHGRSFADSGAKSVLFPANTGTKLDNFVMERTTGGIAGTVFDRGTGTPVNSGMYLVYAFNEQGHLVAGSGYSSSATPLTGAYHIKGLWPGTYRLLAMVQPVNSSNYLTQWYGGVDVHPDSVMEVPMPLVPSGAHAVVVTVGTTPSMDFYVSLTTGVRSVSSAQQPERYVLEQNYPNPFNPSTEIGYTMAGTGHEAIGNRWVKLAVYDILGREVVVLVNEMKEPGSYLVTWDARGMASGVYFCRMGAGGFVQTRKMLLVR
jgi:hypothetical protein